VDKTFQTSGTFLQSVVFRVEKGCPQLEIREFLESFEGECLLSKQGWKIEILFRKIATSEANLTRKGGKLIFALGLVSIKIISVYFLPENSDHFS
jgi:hypothetical protein